MSQVKFEEHITLAQAAEIAGLARNTLKVQARNNRLQAVKLGRDWFTTREWLQQYLDSRQTPGQYHSRFRESNQHP